MPLYALLVALLLGVAADVTLVERSWTFSYIDAVGIGLAVIGAVTAWRRRQLRVDLALAGYGLLLVVIGVQALTMDQSADIVGGSSRFVTAAFVLFGMSQLAPADAARTERWRWPLAFGVFGGVLAVWVVVPFVAALADPTVTTFYDVKNAVVTPLGASNYLAAFLLVSFLISFVHAAEARRRWFGFAALALIGLLATMSRGAIAAALVVLLGLAYAWRERHVLVRAVAIVGATAAAFGVVAAVAAGMSATPGDVELASPELPDDETPAVRGSDRRPSSVAPGDAPSPRPSGLAQLDGVLNDIAIGGRQQLYRASWEAFLERPLLGVGVNQLEEYSGAGGHPPHVNAHNLTLHALATTGVLGTLAYLAVWTVLLWRLWRLPSGTARTALLAGVVGLLLHAQVEALTHTRAVEALLATVLALAAGAPGAFGVRTIGPDSAGEDRSLEPQG